MIKVKDLTWKDNGFGFISSHGYAIHSYFETHTLTIPAVYGSFKFSTLERAMRAANAANKLTIMQQVEETK